MLRSDGATGCNITVCGGAVGHTARIPNGRTALADEYRYRSDDQPLAILTHSSFNVIALINKWASVAKHCRKHAMYRLWGSEDVKPA